MNTSSEFWVEVVKRWCIYQDKDMLVRVKEIADNHAEHDMQTKSAYTWDDIFEEDDDE